MTCAVCKNRIANLYNQGAFGYEKLPEEAHSIASKFEALAAEIESTFLSASNRTELIAALYRMRSSTIDRKIEEIETQQYYQREVANDRA